MRLDFSSHPHWPEVESVLLKIQSAGYSAMIAGGAVRDALLGRSPKDFDIATNANEAALKKIFPKALSVGQQFGIFILAYKDFQIEVAGFRKEGEYVDGRRPSFVEPGTIDDDAARRDFTINAMFYDPKAEQIIDLVDGQKDLKDRIIRCVGEADKRFQEDHLRVLRAIRFAAQLDFKIEEKTFEAIKTYAPFVLRVSPERITQEWLRLLGEKSSYQGLKLSVDSGLFSLLFPKLAEDKVCFAFQSSPRAQACYLLALMLKASFADAKDQLLLQPKEIKACLDEALNCLRLPNKEVIEIQRGLEVYQKIGDQGRREGELYALLLKTSEPRAWLRFWGLNSALSSEMTQAEVALDKILADQRDRAYLSGADFKNVGLPPGPKMGELLQEAYLLQLEGQLNSRAEALSWLKDQGLGLL